MSVICAVGGPASLQEIGTAFDACYAPRSVARGTWISDGAALCVTRGSWEVAPGVAGAARVHERDGVALVSDAALYYRNDLFDSLRIARDRRSGDPGAALLEAYLAGGLDVLRRLEGDFAFALWDSRTGLLVAARDLAGGRALYFAERGGGVIVASSIEVVRAYADPHALLNEVVLAESAAGAWGSATETVFAAVQTVPAGSMLLWRPGTRPVVRAFAEPLRVHGDSRLSFEDAAVELRCRLQGAVAERTAPGGATAVWMSGGVDSTAIYGAGRGAGIDALVPVSVSYPEGDPGREDEIIAEIARMWNVDVRWLSIDALPMLTDLQARMAAHAVPFAHPFARWNAGLAAASRDAGAHVAFSGYGGDQVFHVSDVFLADLLVRGRWIEMIRQLRMRDGAGRRLLQWAIHPALPDRARGLMHRLADWPAHHYLARPLPFWIRRDFATRTGLEERQMEAVQTSAWQHARTETEFYLRNPYFARVLAEVTSIARSHDVELRSPLFDNRVLELALSRPRTDRNDGRSTKRLLRRAVQDLLPRSVTAPRPVKTGLTNGYFERSLRTQAEPLARQLAASSHLADLGIVEPKALDAAWSRYMRRGGENTGTALLFTLQTELWLRARATQRAAVPPLAAGTAS